jgi:hypothetical protein
MLTLFIGFLCFVGGFLACCYFDDTETVDLCDVCGYTIDDACDIFNGNPSCSYPECDCPIAWGGKGKPPVTVCPK